MAKNLNCEVSLFEIYRKRPKQAQCSASKFRCMLLDTARSIRRAAKQSHSNQTLLSHNAILALVGAVRDDHPYFEIEDHGPFMELIRVNSDHSASGGEVRKYVFDQLAAAGRNEKIIVPFMLYCLRPSCSLETIQEIYSAGL